jgi:hypothetical protein
MTRRFPAPWSIRELEQAFHIEDTNGQAVAYTYFRKDDSRRTADISTAERVGSREMITCGTSRRREAFLIGCRARRRLSDANFPLGE